MSRIEKNITGDTISIVFNHSDNEYLMVGAGGGRHHAKDGDKPGCHVSIRKGFVYKKLKLGQCAPKDIALGDGCNLFFTNPKSIDVVIEKLKDAKKCYAKMVKIIEKENKNAPKP